VRAHKQVSLTRKRLCCNAMATWRRPWSGSGRRASPRRTRRLATRRWKARAAATSTITPQLRSLSRSTARQTSPPAGLTSRSSQTRSLCRLRLTQTSRVCPLMRCQRTSRPRRKNSRWPRRILTANPMRSRKRSLQGGCRSASRRWPCLSRSGFTTRTRR